MKQIAKQNIKIHAWINFLSGVVFLVPIISLYYSYVGLSLAEIILISNIASFSIWIFELPTSVLADTTGRKRSLLFSVVFNFLFSLIILVYPSLIGFSIAAIFQALYYSFWSGTGQAFLQENLRILKREKEFGKVIGSFMFYGQLASIVTPLIASLILKFSPLCGFKILAGIDVFFAAALIVLTTRLTETTQLNTKIKNFKHALHVNWDTAVSALKNVFGSKKLRLFMVYRSFSHHVLFLEVLLLPLLSEKGMLDWMSGFIMALFVVASMFASKFAYKIGEKYGYNKSWVLSTIAQAICLILIGLVINSWVLVVLIYFCFSIFDGLIAPSWNHSLVQLTGGKAIATTRSIIFAILALYMTIGKQVLILFTIQQALIGLGIFILLSNFFFARRILSLEE